MSSSQLPWPGPYLATVGVFDGLHLGHRAIIDRLRDECLRTGLPSVLYTFQPRPVTVFAPGTPPDELTPLPRKLRLLAEAGIDRVAVLEFSPAFAAVSAEDFLERVLGAGSGLRGIWVGHDFRFGHRRRGDWAFLARDAARRGYAAVRVDAVRDASGEAISSSAIRSRIQAGEIEQAARLLGRYPDLEGIVVPGRGEGRKLLVPTANLELPKIQCLPAGGVYAGEAEWNGTWYPAVMNLGRRPTLTGDGRLVPEVHVLEREEDLIGRRLLFRMRQRLREERKFPSLVELRQAVEADLARTRSLAGEWG